MEPIAIARALDAETARLRFGPPVAFVYRPLDYAREPHEDYLRRYAKPAPRALLLGMNPGPYGMTQTGVPFGEVAAARDWLRVSGTVSVPREQHPKRPIEGFACARSEVSGRRFWAWARERHQTPERFFARYFVWNWCPLVFLADSGRNLTPDKLPRIEREPLAAACDRALRAIVAALRPEMVVGVGAFAAARARAALGETGTPIGGILHPSPASPAANRGWAAQAQRELEELGIE